MKFNKIVTVALSSFFSITAVQLEASEFKYNYVELGVADAIDDADPTFNIAGSFDVASNVNLFASYASTTLESSGDVDLDFDRYDVGIGYHTSVNEKTDMTANVKYIGTEIELTNGFSTASLGDGSGYGVGIGVRHKVSDSLEAYGSVDYVDVEEATETSVTAGGRYYFNDKISAGLGYTSGDFDGVNGTLRFNF